MGGHTRYALPTAAATQLLTDRLECDVAGTPLAPLVRLMLPQTRRRALRLTEASTPNWIAHQTEINTLVLRLCDAAPLLWMSSWDCPLPRRVASFDLPQPDYVAVEGPAAGPRMVFGEHDRGSEPVERFIARKVLLYAALAAFPDACEQHFGFRTFSVRVTVTDPVRRHPMQRIAELLTATYRAGGPHSRDLFRFTLAGWLNAAPDEAIWFSPGDVVAHHGLQPSQHVVRRLP
jgi:hypothetical protein